MIDSELETIVRRAAVRATMAPSIHNTQPWRFVMSHDTLEIHRDPDRQLHDLDPHGRQVVISCGCALFNARVAIAAGGLRAVVHRFPTGSDSTLTAVIKVTGRSDSESSLATLNSVIEAGRLIRPSWNGESVPPRLLDTLIGTSGHDGAQLHTVTRQETLHAIAGLPRPTTCSHQREHTCRAGPQAWMSEALPQPPTQPRDTSRVGGSGTYPDLRESLLLLGAGRDDPTSWLRTGESMQRIILEITRRGYAASPIAQVIETPRTSALLRDELGVQAYPHALLLVGPALSTPQLRRRRLVEVLTQIG